MESRKNGKGRIKPNEVRNRILKQVIALVLTVIAVFMAFQIGQPYINHYVFKRDLLQAISYVGARSNFNANNRSDENIRKDVIGIAQKNNITLEEKNITIRRDASGVEIRIVYPSTIDYFIMKQDIFLQAKGNSTKP